MAGIDSYVKLMLHCNRPDATAPKAVTFAGTGCALDTAEKKFGTASLLPDRINDGNLTIPDSTDWDYGSGNWTIDFWIKPVDAATNVIHGICGQFVDTTHYNYIFYRLDSSYPGGAKYKLFWYDLNGTTEFFVITQPLLEGSWYHVAICRNGNTVSAYVNGTLSTDVNATCDVTSWTAQTLASVMFIGYDGDSRHGRFPGWIDSFRWSKGLARFTGNFAPILYAPVSDSNTQLLLHFDGADTATATYDSAGGDENGTADKAITYGGTAQIDTAQSKFGGASILLDGNSDYIQFADSDDWNFGTGSFTIDFWVRFSTVQTCGFWEQYVDGTHWGGLYYNNTSHQIYWYWINGSGGANTGTIIASWTPSQDTWYHVEIVRSGTAAYLFIDGSALSISGDFTNTCPDFAAVAKIGTYTDASAFLAGWVEEFRVSKGIARHTAGFTPRTTEYSTAPDTTIKKVAGVTYAQTKKISGVSIASVKKVIGVA